MKAYFLFLAVLLVSVTMMPTHATSVAVNDVSITPAVLHKGDDATVTIVFDENISDISMLYCQLTPEYSCHYPLLELENTSTNTYTVTFEVQEDDDSTFGFEFRITTTDNTLVTYPESSESIFGFKITSPLEGFYYFTVNVGNPPTSTTEPTPFPILISGIAIMIISRKKY